MNHPTTGVRRRLLAVRVDETCPECGHPELRGLLAYDAQTRSYPWRVIAAFCPSCCESEGDQDAVAEWHASDAREEVAR